MVRGFSMVVASFSLSMVLLLPAAASDCDVAETNQEQAECLNASYESADSELNYAYQELQSVLEEMTSADELKAAQRAWVKFRDVACEAEASVFEGGSAERLVRLDCLARVTWSRVADLNVLLELVGDYE